MEQGARHFPHGHFLIERRGNKYYKVPDEKKKRECKRGAERREQRGLTSPLALMRLVCRRSPVPQEFWLFHTTSVGGLWVPLPEAAQICKGKSLQEIIQKEIQWCNRQTEQILKRFKDEVFSFQI